MDARTPIYDQEHLQPIIGRLRDGNTCNMGLFFDKYLADYRIRNNDVELPQRNEGPDFKALQLDRLCKKMKGYGTVDRLLKSTHERLDSIVESQGGLKFEVSSVWNLVTGLGQPHPFETGFRWDYNLGLPVIPGSGIKGMLGTWLRYYKSDRDSADRILGSKDKVGSCVFFDAYPRSRPGLVVDVMSVHFKEYYEDRRNSIEPSDYFDPVPIHFLTVAPGTSFVFRVVPRNNFSDDLAKVEKWMREALETIGFGAKTAVGYGRFK
ncbi:MAG: type III-B CRISPR module RAMP protein Cmr6 [Candidatus Thorarchaeota archaeon]|nr:MAG: type III-B CRISPR module RAMP protein Cmr6 [Candidatus Thorarchaeota archaeon]